MALITHVPVLFWPLNASLSLFKGRKEGQNGLVDLRAPSSPQIKIFICLKEQMLLKLRNFHTTNVVSSQEEDGSKEQNQPPAAAQVKQRKKGSSKSGTRRERVVGKFGRSYKRAEVSCR